MSIWKWNDIALKIGNSGIMADSASLETTNSVQPIYGIGLTDVFAQTPNGPIKSTINFSYFLEVSNDQIFPQIPFYKADLSSYAGTGISLGGISGSFYMESMSLKISPNTPAKMNCSYTSYFPLTGSLQQKERSTVFNISQSSGLAHGWSTFVTLSNSTTYPIYELDYTLRNKWEPEFVCGSLYPNQVHLMGVDESISVVRDIYIGLNPSGDGLKTYLELQDDSISLYEIALNDSSLYQNSLSISLADFTTKSTSISASIDDFIRVAVSAEKSS